MPGMMSGRPELIRAVRGYSFKPEDVALLVDAVATLVETNQALQHHCQAVATRVEHLRMAVKNMAATAEHLQLAADFTKPLPSRQYQD